MGQTFNTTNFCNQKCSIKDCINDGANTFVYRNIIANCTVFLCDNHSNAYGEKLQTDIDNNGAFYLYQISDQLLF